MSVSEFWVKNKMFWTINCIYIYFFFVLFTDSLCFWSNFYALKHTRNYFSLHFSVWAAFVLCIFVFWFLLRFRFTFLVGYIFIACKLTFRFCVSLSLFFFIFIFSLPKLWIGFWGEVHAKNRCFFLSRKLKKRKSFCKHTATTAKK